MDHKDFCYWLNGYFELCKSAGIEPEFTTGVVKVVKDHLDLVFNKVTPTYHTGGIISSSPSINWPSQATC